MKKSMIWAIVTALIMVGLPWLAVVFVQGPDGMAVVFLLFFAVDPVFSAATGVFAGQDAGKRWSLPILTALLYLTGVWTFFDREEPLFLCYAAAYLVLGVAAMGITALVKKRKSK